MKRKIFSKLLMVALVIAAVGSFVSCKDYDDDINNLQNQINKAALQSELAALQQTVANNATAAKAAADAAEAAAKKYADELAAKSTAKAADLEKLIAEVKAIADAAATQKALDEVKAIADAAATKDELSAVKAIADAAATQAALTEAIATLNGAIEKVKAVADAAATKDELDAAKKELTEAIGKVETAAAAAKKLAEDAQAAADKAQATADKANTDLAAEVTRAKEAEKKLEEAIAKALADAKKYTDDALTASKAYTDDEVEKAAAKAADDLAKAIANVYTKAEVDKLIGDAKTAAAEDAAAKLAKALGDLGTASVKDYVNTEIGDAVADLKEELADTYLTKEDFEKITGVSGSLTASVDALYSAVTSVSLYKADWSIDENGLGHNGQSGLLNFVKVKEQENKFPTDAKKAEADNQYIFTKDKYVTYEDSIIVRVSPASATLTADMIELINSQGNTLTSEVSVVKVARYNKLLTRAADGNGLWTITYKLKDGYDENAFLASTVFDTNEDGKLEPMWNGGADRNILFAVAVNNTKDDAADRRIVSEYDVTVNTGNAAHARWFKVKPAKDENASWIYNIHNRYWYSEQNNGLQNTKEIEELVWDYTVTDGAVAPILTGDAKNVITRWADDAHTLDNGTDNRQGNRFLYVDVNEEIEIEFPNAAARPLKGFYVTLDRDFAVESYPSEINAWDSYSYTNVGTKNKAAHMIDGNKGVISVNSEVAKGDYIGFRVYAVNLDGTLVDPDGRAFYIHVGRLEDTTQKLAADVIADRITPTSKVAKTAVFDNTEDNNVRYVWNIKDAATDFPAGLPGVNKINYVDKDGAVVATTTLGTWGYLSTADAKKVVGITVEFANIAQVYNDQTVTFEAKVYRQINAGGAWQNMEIGLVEAKITKKLPDFPANLQGRAAQFTNANATDHFSTGTLNLFLLEKVDKWKIADWTNAAALNEGKVDLVSAFYNLDNPDAATNYNPANIEFSFAESDKDASNKLIAVPATSTAGTGTHTYAFPLTIKKAYIDNTTTHATTVSYNYGLVSTYKNAAGTTITENYKPSKTFTTIYDCLWDTKWMSYAWKENKAANVPSFTVGDAGKSIAFNTIYTQNAYNATIYGNAYKTITLADFASKLTFTKVTLTSNETGKEDYFTCAFDAGFTQINLTPTEDWHNPTANVPSTLTISYTDPFGHKESITLDVTVKKQ